MYCYLNTGASLYLVPPVAWGALPHHAPQCKQLTGLCVLHVVIPMFMDVSYPAYGFGHIAVYSAAFILELDYYQHLKLHSTNRQHDFFLPYWHTQSLCREKKTLSS